MSRGNILESLGGGYPTPRVTSRLWGHGDKSFDLRSVRLGEETQSFWKRLDMVTGGVSRWCKTQRRDILKIRNYFGLRRDTKGSGSLPSTLTTMMTWKHKRRNRKVTRFIS